MIKRDSHYFINDMEIPVQAMDTTALEVGLSDRIYIGRNTLYVRLGHKQGTGWMGAQKYLSRFSKDKVPDVAL